MSRSLPAKLGKEPLIDVIFEVRFESQIAAGSLLPGLLLQFITEQPTIETLPASQLPIEIRNGDEALRHVHLTRMSWGQKFSAAFGDRTLSVICRMPYAGWTEYKQAIMMVMECLREARFVQKVQRYSLKYVDFFESKSSTVSGFERFNIDLNIGSRKIDKEITNLRCEIPEGNFIHAVTVLTAAYVEAENHPRREGSIFEVDSLCLQDFSNVPDFLDKLPNLLDEIHQSNKACFFSCLSEKGLTDLEPIYDDRSVSS